jgi:hypothetical protein
LRELDVTLHDSTVGKICEPVFARPGVDRVEQRLVRRKNVIVGQQLRRFEIAEGLFKAGDKGGVLQPLDNGEIFFLGMVVEIAACSEVAERIGFIMIF